MIDCNPLCQLYDHFGTLGTQELPVPKSRGYETITPQNFDSSVQHENNETFSSRQIVKVDRHHELKNKKTNLCNRMYNFFSKLLPQKEQVHEDDEEKKVLENCNKLEQQISGLKLWIQQIQTFVESYKALDDIFQEVLRKNSDQFVLTTVPVLESNKDDPYDYQYILTRELNHSKRQIRELIKFIAVNAELWNCFIYHVQKTKSNDMKKLFNLIFQLLKENIDKSDYQSIKKLLIDEVQELKESHLYDEKFIRRILLKLSGSVFDFQFFSEQLLVKNETGICDPLSLS